MNNLVKVTTLAVFVLVTSTVFAADLSLGIDLNVGTGVGSVRTGELNEQYGVTDNNINPIVGADLSAKMLFGDKSNKFMFRPEVGITLNNGVGSGFRFTYDDYTIGVDDSSECSISVTVIDVPLLFGLETEISEEWSINYYLGPYISIPVSGKFTTSAGVTDLEFTNPSFGSTAGVTGNLNTKSGAFTFDMRYLFDLTATKMNNNSIYARRNIVVSIGYELDV